MVRKRLYLLKMFTQTFFSTAKRRTTVFLALKPLYYWEPASTVPLSVVQALRWFFSAYEDDELYTFSCFPLTCDSCSLQVSVLDLLILSAILEVKLPSVITSFLIAASGAKWRGRCRDLRLCIGVSWPHLPRLHPVPRLHGIQRIQPILFNPARITWSERTVIGEILKSCSPLKSFIWTEILGQPRKVFYRKSWGVNRRVCPAMYSVHRHKSFKGSALLNSHS